MMVGEMADNWVGRWVVSKVESLVGNWADELAEMRAVVKVGWMDDEMVEKLDWLDSTMVASRAEMWAIWLE